MSLALNTVQFWDVGQLPDIPSKANVCSYTAAPAAAPVYSEGIWFLQQCRDCAAQRWH